MTAALLTLIALVVSGAIVFHYAPTRAERDAFSSPELRARFVLTDADALDRDRQRERADLMALRAHRMDRPDPRLRSAEPTVGSGSAAA